MNDVSYYEAFIRARITELRLERNVSEHHMSLELGKSGSYIRSITSGRSLPSLRELFHICQYFDLTPPAFFATMECSDSAQANLMEKLRKLNAEELEKVSTFIDWINQ